VAISFDIAPAIIHIKPLITETIPLAINIAPATINRMASANDLKVA
jgi:hypothetical protein